MNRADRIATILLVAVYMVIEIALAISHQPWRDEAQAWLWAQTMAGPVEFFILPGEGHPPLWYWLLRGLSLVLDFSQARYITLGVALINAVLLARLLRGQILLLALLLCSHVVILTWGFNFRPYGLVLTALLTALLAERHGRVVLASWVLALACGLHFYAGFLFGFWLLVQWQRGTRLTSLIGPALLGLFFGACALLSGMGNPESAPSSTDLAEMIAFNLGWPMTWPDLRGWPAALATIALLCLGLWRQRAILIILLALTTLFAIGASAVYGQSPWHSAFMLMMALMAFVLAGPSARLWVMCLLLVPQAVAGIATAQNRLDKPVWTRPDLYQVILDDAGQSLDPTRQLIAWRDFNLTTTAAIHGIGYISGNNGALLGPVDWRKRSEDALDPVLVTTPTPYWLVCGKCGPPLALITGAGRTATPLATGGNFDDGVQTAYRID